MFCDAEFNIKRFIKQLCKVSNQFSYSFKAPPASAQARERFRISLLSDESPPQFSADVVSLPLPSQLAVDLRTDPTLTCNSPQAATFDTEEVIVAEISSQSFSTSASTNSSPGQKRKEIGSVDSQPAPKESRISSETADLAASETVDVEESTVHKSSSANALKKKIDAAKPRLLPPKLEDQRRIKAEELQRKQLEAEKRRKKIEEEEKKRLAEKMESKKRKEEIARTLKVEEEAAKRARLEEKKVFPIAQKNHVTEMQSKIAVSTDNHSSSSPKAAIVPNLISAIPKPKQQQLAIPNPVSAPSTSLVLTSASLTGVTPNVDRLMSPPPSRPPRAISPPKPACTSRVASPLKPSNANVGSPSTGARRRGPVNTPDADNYEMSDHQDSDWDDEDSKEPNKPVPAWAKPDALNRALQVHLFIFCQNLSTE